MQANPSSLVFGGKQGADIAKFLSVYENVVMRGKTGTDKAGKLFSYLQGEAFDLNYDTYSHNGELTDEASDYQAVRKALLDRFQTVEKPEDNIRVAVASRLDHSDLSGSLNEMEGCFDKASFNAEAKFGQLRNAVMAHVDLAQFVLYRAPTSYETLNRSVEDFLEGREAFLAERPAQLFDPSAPRRILQRPERFEKTGNIEKKVESLADQLAELSLLVKKKQIVELTEIVRTCSFCKEPGHSAVRCLSNPNRDFSCPKCGKQGHGEDTCWSKFGVTRPNVDTPRKTADNAKDGSGGAQVTYIDESRDGDVVAAAKRNLEGEALPKQRKTYEEVAIPRVLNPPFLQE